MTLQQMKYALTIAEQGSMNKAAEQLYVTQPSLTGAVKELEKELAPFITVRKGLMALCGLMWAFAAFCLLTGTLEMKIFLPMCMFALAALAGVNVPIFVKKKKIFDGIIAGICTVICFVTGVIILMFG